MWCFKISNGRTHGTALPAGFKKYAALIFIVTAAAGLWAKGSVDSETAKAYFDIAQAYTDVSKYDKAAEFYRKAAKDPAHKNAAEYNLARVYGLQGDWAKARPILERQYQEAPGNLLILKAYAYSLAATGDEERACVMYKKLADEDAENPDSAINYGRILVLAKKYDEATALLTELKTRFTETAEKKQLDDLEEKIKKAQEPPEKPEDEDADTDDTAADADKTKRPDGKSNTEKAKSPNGKAAAADETAAPQEDTASAGSAARAKPAGSETADSKKADAQTEKVKNGKKT